MPESVDLESNGGPESKGRVLIVEDQFLAAEFLRIWVEAYGFDVCGTAISADQAVELARQHQPTHILMDVRLEGERDGIDAAIEIQTFAAPRIIYCTGSSETSTVNRINADHPFDILFKPVSPQLLGEALTRT
jgi:DNA-binding NarL/FixJ family response regulator